MEWFYANENDEQIRFEESDLERLTRDGVIKKDTLVWNESMIDWQECHTVRPELFETKPEGSSDHDLKPTLRAVQYFKTGPESTVVPDPSRFSDPTQSSPPPPPPQENDSGMPPAMPGSAYGVKPPGPADGLAVGSLICGIIGLVATLCSGLGLPISIAAVVCGMKANTKLREAGHPTSDGRVTAGLVTGWIGVVLGALAVIGFIIYMLFVATAIATEI